MKVHLAAPGNGSSLHILDKMTPLDHPHRDVAAPYTQTIDKEVDRIFHAVAPTIGLLIHPARQVAIKVRNVVSADATGEDGLVDAVVWNPWVNKSRAMADFGDDECVSRCLWCAVL